MIRLLIRSLERKEKVMIYYLDNNNNLTQRIVQVVEADDTNLLAYCYFRKQVRSFKIDNILSCGPVKRSAGA